MKIKNLSSLLQFPFWLAELEDVRIIFDFPLNLLDMMKFSPTEELCRIDTDQHSHNQFLINVEGHTFLSSQLPLSYLFDKQQSSFIIWDTIDLVLISNFDNILGIPFLYKSCGFRGTVMATEPTVQYGRQILEDLVLSLQQTPAVTDICNSDNQSSTIKDIPLNLQQVIKNSYPMYTMADIDHAFNQIRKVSFNEHISLFGNVVKVYPMSSGYSIGSCNWMVEAANEHLMYMSASSLWSCHAAVLSVKDVGRVDKLILHGLSTIPGTLPDTSIDNLSSSLVFTLQAGGSVLLPCYPCGLTYDLLETVANVLDNENLRRIPMYFISHRARHSLSYSDIYGEWLSKSKQDKIYTADSPFFHSELLNTGRLKHFDSIHSDLNKQFTAPCVVFTGHPSLRAGVAVHFAKLWASNPKNSIILTNPIFCNMEVMAPFQPVSARVFMCPLDMQLLPTQCNELLDRLQPNDIILPKYHIDEPFFTTGSSTVHYLDEMELVELAEHGSENETVEISAELARSIQPVDIEDNQMGLFSCVVTKGRSCKRMLDVVPSSDDTNKDSKLKLTPSASRLVLGRFTADDLVKQLRSGSFPDAKVDTSDDGSCSIFLELGTQEALITLDSDSTHIYCDDEKMRLAVRDALLACLTVV